MIFIRRLAWALERGQALGLDENQVAGNSVTSGTDLRLQFVESYPWLKIVLITAELIRTLFQFVPFSFDLLPGYV